LVAPPVNLPGSGASRIFEFLERFQGRTPSWGPTNSWPPPRYGDLLERTAVSRAFGQDLKGGGGPLLRRGWMGQGRATAMSGVPRVAPSRLGHQVVARWPRPRSERPMGGQRSSQDAGWARRLSQLSPRVVKISTKASRLQRRARPGSLWLGTATAATESQQDGEKHAEGPAFSSAPAIPRVDRWCCAQGPRLICLMACFFMTLCPGTPRRSFGPPRDLVIPRAPRNFHLFEERVIGPGSTAAGLVLGPPFFFLVAGPSFRNYDISAYVLFLATAAQGLVEPAGAQC